ncbi:hypothetical protein AX16_004168 [Volvariella volvacea WC 439]|nr:hypothetical protein AX16_004168 [Volvariella volvacea WC 439]
MSIYLEDLFQDVEINFKHEVFQDLTHLEVMDDGDSAAFQWEEGNNYSCPPKLRYLAFSNVPTHKEVIRDCLEECEGLEVLILSGIEVDETDFEHWH